MSSDISSDMSSDILSGISIDVSSDISIDISSDILVWHIIWHIFWHNLLTFVLTYLLTFFLTFFSDTSFDIASGSWGPALPAPLGSSRVRPGAAQSARELPGEVRRCPLRSEPAGRGPALPGTTFQETTLTCSEPPFQIAAPGSPAVGSARPQQGAPDRSGQRRSSIGNSSLQWAAPGLPRGALEDWAPPDFTRGALERTGQRRTSPGELLSGVGSAGPQLPEGMSKDMSEICQPRIL